MPKLAGVNHLDVVRALEKAGFRVALQSKHIVMTDGSRILTMPRHNPVNAFTMVALRAMPVCRSTNVAPSCEGSLATGYCGCAHRKRAPRAVYCERRSRAAIA
jgi:hypothetical protein